MASAIEKDFPSALVIQRTFSASILERLQMQIAP
jgi:hypothetical protein